MKKYLIIILVLASFFSCTKEGVVEPATEKINFDEAYLSNLQEMNDLTPHVDLRIATIHANPELIADGIDEYRFDYLFKKTSLSENETTEFLGMLNATGFKDLESFYEYNQAISNLRVQLLSNTNIEEKTSAEQEAVFEAVLKVQLKDVIRTTSSLRDPCQIAYDKCLQDARDWTINCSAACVAGGILVGIFTVGLGGVAAGGSCIAGCIASEQIDIHNCNLAYQACVATTPLPTPTPTNTGGN